MPITIANAYIASLKGGAEVAYFVEYSEGPQVRVVVAAGGWLRKEYLKAGAWIAAGKPYVINHNRKRQGERLIEAVKAWLA